jgi:mono/diheme cytochrome c family protein
MTNQKHFGFARMKEISKTIAIILCCPVLAAIAGSNTAPSEVSLGKQIFERTTCQSCHPGGDNTLHPSKPLKGPAFAGKYKDDAAIAKVVRQGVPNTGMPAFSKIQVSDRDLKLVIAYIRSLTPQAKVKTTKQP